MQKKVPISITVKRKTKDFIEARSKRQWRSVSNVIERIIEAEIEAEDRFLKIRSQL